MDIKYYMSMGTDIDTMVFYPLETGLSKVELGEKSSYYSGTYLGSGKTFFRRLDGKQSLSFEGVYKKDYPLHEFFLKLYFRQISTGTVGIVCRTDDVIYYGEGAVEIKKLESGPREIKVEGSVVIDYGWAAGLVEDIIIYGENTADTAESASNQTEAVNG